MDNNETVEEVTESLPIENKIAKVGSYRWTILALVFYATSVNYFDRSIIGVLAPTLTRLFGWSNTDYANIQIAFKAAYAVGMLTMGGIIDRLGTKKGYALSIGIWSIFGMLHAVVRASFSVINCCRMVSQKRKGTCNRDF